MNSRVVWHMNYLAFFCSQMCIVAGCCAVSSRKSKGCNVESALQLSQVLFSGEVLLLSFSYQIFHLIFFCLNKQASRY
jgi:hypothetical protein